MMCHVGVGSCAHFLVDTNSWEIFLPVPLYCIDGGNSTLTLSLTMIKLKIGGICIAILPGRAWSRKSFDHSNAINQYKEVCGVFCGVFLFLGCGVGGGGGG